MREPAHLYGASPQGLCASVFLCFCVFELLCSCAGGCADGLMCESLYVCTVRAHKGFTQCAGARPPGLCTTCFCAHARTCADELMCESLHICTVLAHKGFVLLCSCAGGCADELMCESLYVCTMRAPKGFMQRASELVYICLRPRVLCAVCTCR